MAWLASPCTCGCECWEGGARRPHGPVPDEDTLQSTTDTGGP